MQAHVLLARIVVDEADRRVAEARGLQHLADDELPGVAGADDQRLPAAGDEPARAGPLDQRPRSEARASDEREHEQPVDRDHAAGHAPAVDGTPEVEDDDDRDRRDGDGEDRPPHVADRYVPPPVLVEAEGDEHRELTR